MPEVVMAQRIAFNDPKIQKVISRVAREAELAIEKVAANAADAARFPMPTDANCMEQILARRFKALPGEVQGRAGTVALGRIKLSAAKRAARFADLSTVDLTKAVAVEKQVDALPQPSSLRLTREQLFAEAAAGIEPATPSAARAAVTSSRLELRIHKVLCVDETNGFLGSEAGDDEIKLGGTTVDETGDTKKVTPFVVRNDFDDREQQVYSPPRVFTQFNLREGTDFPKAYFVTFVLAEADNGGISDFVNKLLDKVKERVTAALVAAGIKVGVASGGPVGAIIGAAVGFVVGKVFDFIKDIWKDDLFDPVTASLRISSYTWTWPGGKRESPEAVATFKGHGGEYRLWYSWRLS